MFRGAGRYLSVAEPAMVRWPCCVCCACWDGFCTVWWYLELVLCWRGGSFGLLRRLLSSIPPASAMEPGALFGEPTRCCAGSGAEACRSASLPRDSATRPSPLDTLWRRVRREMGWCSRMAPRRGVRRNDRMWYRRGGGGRTDVEHQARLRCIVQVTFRVSEAGKRCSPGLCRTMCRR